MAEERKDFGQKGGYQGGFGMRYEAPGSAYAKFLGASLCSEASLAEQSDAKALVELLNATPAKVPLTSSKQDEC